MVNLGLWQEKIKNTLSPPIKSKQTGETLPLSCKWAVQEANLFALSYLIHTSPRQRSERRLCSNPPLLIPPSLHSSLLHPSPLPPSLLLSIPGYYLSSAGPCLPAHFCSECNAKKKKSQSEFTQQQLWSSSGFFLYLSVLCVYHIKKTQTDSLQAEDGE